jgi:hypothetical protein
MPKVNGIEKRYQDLTDEDIAILAPMPNPLKATEQETYKWILDSENLRILKTMDQKANEVKLKNIRDILKEWLIAHNCDGLCSPPCECDLNNLLPSPHDLNELNCVGFGDCFPAIRVKCKPEDCNHCGASCKNPENQYRLIPKENLT